MENNLNYKFIVYITTNNINNFIYVGVHKTLTPYEFDGYLGNGIYINRPNTYEKSKTKFQQAVKEFGIKAFTRKTLNVFDNEDDAYLLEKNIIDSEFLSRHDVYNVLLGGIEKEKPFNKIYRYLKSGEYDSEYQNGRLASEAINCCDKTIYNACILGNLVNDRYYFSYIKDKNYSTARTEYIKHMPVHKYDRLGYYICSYDTYTEAQSEHKNINIIKSIKLKSHDEDGNIWGLVKLTYYNRPKLPKQKRRVGRFDLDDNLIEAFQSATQAAKVWGNSVWNVLAGRNETQKGFKFKYLS